MTRVKDLALEFPGLGKNDAGKARKPNVKVASPKISCLGNSCRRFVLRIGTILFIICFVATHN